MTESKVLEALFPGTRHIVLSAMFADPDRWWSLAELAGIAGVLPGTLQVYLTRLRRGGVIRTRGVSAAVQFQPDANCSIFLELQRIVVKLTQPPICGETVLVVEDAEATAQLTRILLESWGYLVLEAHGAREALDVSDSHPERIHLLLTDVNMPGMSGPQLADELTRRRPGLRIVFMSGNPAGQLSGRGNVFLPKPFNPFSLSQAIRKTLDEANLHGEH